MRNFIMLPPICSCHYQYSFLRKLSFFCDHKLNDFRLFFFCACFGDPRDAKKVLYNSGQSDAGQKETNTYISQYTTHPTVKFFCHKKRILL